MNIPPPLLPFRDPDNEGGPPDSQPISIADDEDVYQFNLMSAHCGLIPPSTTSATRVFDLSLLRDISNGEIGNGEQIEKGMI